MALAVDGTGTGIGNAVSSMSASITTASSGDIILCMVGTECITSQAGYSTVKSVTGNGLTFVQASGSGGAAQVQFQSATAAAFVNTEIWWAFQPAATTATFTAALTGKTLDDGAMILMGVSGFTGTNYHTNPFDTNATTPNVNSTSTATTVVSGTFSTTSTNTFVVSLGNTQVDQFASASTVGGVAATQSASASETAGANFDVAFEQHAALAAASTNIKSTFAANNIGGWGCVTVVLSQAGSPSGGNPFQNTDWVYGIYGWYHDPNRLTITPSWTWRQVDKIGRDVLPNRPNQRDWPNPYPIESYPYRTLEVNITKFIGKDVLPFRDDYRIFQNLLFDVRDYRTWEWNQVRYQGKDILPFRNDYRLPQNLPQEFRDYRSWEWREVLYIGKDILPFRIPTGIESREFRDYRDWFQRFQLTPVVSTTPFFQLDWPLTPDNRRYVDYFWRQVGYLGQDVLPFGRASNEVPRDPREFREWYWRQVDKLGLDTLPFRIATWIESREFREYRDWYQRFLTPPTVSNPFYQTDWPNPRDPREVRDWSWRQVGYLGRDQLPIRQQDWPLPYPVVWYQDWKRDFQNFLIGKDVLPFRQLDWQNPVLVAIPAGNNIDTLNPNLYPSTTITFILMPQICL